MSIHIYNSLSRKKEEFIPLQPGKVKMYVCGVTVYDTCHIGHLRGAYVFEVIKNFLKYRGYEVKYVKNITDVDDKIIDRARQYLEKKDLKQAVREVVDKYLKLYREDEAGFGLTRPDIEPRATEHIPEIIKITGKLIAGGFAYESEGNVYFEVAKFKDYGRLSNQNPEELQAGGDRKSGEGKRNSLDFALWKRSKPDEPGWESPWGEGRPGWHIECSAMSMKYLGEEFDIHGGGIDLIFPHHENEIAQSCAFSNKGFARFWVHNGLLTVNGRKMSKSLNNFITVKDLLQKHTSDQMKLFFLSAHYQSPIDFTFEKMEEAKKSNERFSIFFNKVERLVRNAADRSQKGENLKQRSSEIEFFTGQVDRLKKEFEEALDDNFNTPRALSKLFDLVNLGNRFVEEQNIPEAGRVSLLVHTRSTILKLGKVFGLFNGAQVSETREDKELVDGLLKLIIKIRNKLRKKKEFDLTDEIREDLAKLKIVLEDGKEGTVWRCGINK